MNDFIDIIDQRMEHEMKMSATNDPKILIGLRNIKSEFLLAMSRDTEQQEINVLRKMVKLREETAKIYEGKNMDLWSQEITEKKILDSILPPPIEKEDVLNFLNTLSIQKEMKNFKKLQTECQNKFGEVVDSNYIRQWINS